MFELNAYLWPRHGGHETHELQSHVYIQACYNYQICSTVVARLYVLIYIITIGN